MHRGRGDRPQQTCPRSAARSASPGAAARLLSIRCELPWSSDRPLMSEPFRRVGRVNHYSESVFTVQGHGVHTALLTLASAQRKLGLPVTVNARRSESVLHVHSAGPLALRRLRGHRGVKVISAHVTPATFPGSVIGATRLARSVRSYMRFFFNHGDLVIALSEDVATELRELGVTSRITVIPNGVDSVLFTRETPTRSEARRLLALPSSKTIVLTVGQLQPRKGVQTVIDVARRLPEVEFLWVGDTIFGAFSADRKKLRRTIAAAPPNVTFAGLVPHSAIPTYHRAADIFLFPSRQETFGLAPVEAALSGLPLVLSNLPVFSEVFTSPAMPYLAATTTNDYVDAVAKLAASASLRDTLGHQARTVALRYDADLIAHRTTEAYLDAIDQAPRKARTGRP
ncbi:glycosyltransferase family 4 protein [Kutzneria sp. NPDC052558]|uniref:glycosyltransferase family 4 protein n=1 Tax=Kutzneria sp. NPDC052558 TaxID=3364121 RepID=UPI0037C85DEF